MTHTTDTTTTATTRARTIRWRLRVAWIALPLAAAATCALQPADLRLWFPDVNPTGAFAAVVCVALLLAMLVLPAAIARLVERAPTLRAALGSAVGEVAVLAALLGPALVASWKHAPHGQDGLLAAVPLLLVVMLACAIWGVADAASRGRLSRWLVALATFVIGLPLIGYALWDYADRQPWWMELAHPVWLMIDAAPPRPGMLGSPLFTPALAVWATGAALGLVVAAAWWRRIAAAIVGAGLALLGGWMLLTLSANPPAPAATTAGTTATDTAAGALAAVTPTTPAAPRASIVASWTFGEYGGDGLMLPARVRITPSTDQPLTHAHLLVHAGRYSVQLDLPDVVAGQPHELIAPIVYPPSERRVLIELADADARTLAVAELPVPGFPFARGDGGYVVAVLQGRSPLPIRADDADSRARRRAVITVNASSLPAHPAELACFSGFVLATADIADLSREAREALAQRVRGGALLVNVGYSNALWRDLLDRLALAPPADPPATPWQRGRLVLAIADPSQPDRTLHLALNWVLANRGAGTVVNLVMPPEMRAREAVGAAVLREFLQHMLGNPRGDVQTCYELESRGRLASGRMFTSAVGRDEMRRMPVGSLGSSLFACALVSGLVIIGLRWYRVPPVRAGVALVLGMLALSVALGQASGARLVEVLEVPLIVTRASPGDSGPTRELRWVQVTAARDNAGLLVVASPASNELLPAASAEADYARLPFDLKWPTGVSAGSPAEPARVAFGELRSGEYRLLRLNGLTDPADPAPGLAVDPLGESGRELQVAPGTRLLSVIQVRGFRARVLADSATATWLQLGERDDEADEADPRWRPWRDVVLALRRGESGGAQQLTTRERRVLALVMETAVRKGQEFVLAIMDAQLAPRVTAEGVNTVLRPVVAVSLGD
ncbi:MAG: hypothetical protein AB7K09_25510 [Planctomycetota bacterium]